MIEINYSDVFERAIESKVTAEQEALNKSGLINKVYYVNGKLGTGFYENKYYVNGSLASGAYVVEGEKTATYFNVLRKIVERIFERSKDRKIIAPIRSLNAWSKFLQNKDENYEIIDSIEIMPKALVNSLKYLLDITQDGSHSTSSCFVDKYIRDNGGINIFRSALHITMELCLWYDK